MSQQTRQTIELDVTTVKTDNRTGFVTTVKTENRTGDITTDKTDNRTGDVTTDKTENRTGDVTTDKTENRTGDVTADKTENRSGLTFRSQVWRSPRKRNRRADMKALKRMAGSTETQGPHVHAWRSEMHVWRVQKCGNCVLRTLCEWYALFYFYFFIVFIYSKCVYLDLQFSAQLS